MRLPSWHEDAIAKAHDRASFDCGDNDLNIFLRRYARQSHELGGAKTFLAVDDTDNKTILGVYSIAPGSMDHADTPELARRGLARHEVPGFRLARLATDIRVQGNGCRFPLRIDPVFPSRIDPGEGMSRRAGLGSSW